MKRVGILRGGKKNYKKSLADGGEIIAYIQEHLNGKYKPVDILIDMDGVWHLGGVPVLPADLMHRVDLVWNTADLQFSQTLREFSIPVIAVPIFLTHMLQGVTKVPQKIISPKSAREVHAKFGAPWIVHNGNQVQVIKTFSDLTQAILGDGVVVEEFIGGVPSAVHAISGFRNEDIYIVSDKNLNKEGKERARELATKLHQHLSHPQYFKLDFILRPRGGVCVTNIVFSPDLRSGSHLEESLHSVGARMPHFVEHILESVSN